MEAVSKGTTQQPPCSLTPAIDEHNMAAMSVAVALILALLGNPYGLNYHHHIDVATVENIQQREEYLHQKMTQLLEEVEQSRNTEEDTLLSALQSWPFWTVVLGNLALFCVVRWLTREVKLSYESYCQEDDEEEEEDLSGTYNGGEPLVASTPSPVQHLPNKCKVLKDLVIDLLRVCQEFCKRTSMLQMHPAIEEDSIYATCVAHENNVVYRLLVFLQPSPGHFFSVELDTTGKLLAECSSVRVGLECICLRKQLLGGTCFLHQPGNKLPMDQRSKLLRNLCTYSYLDVEKVTVWFQLLVESAWLLLPQSQQCQLTVLPSSQTCRFQLTGISDVSICTEMIFAVQEGRST